MSYNTIANENLIIVAGTLTAIKPEAIEVAA